jgi:peptidyl-prolyl cis-trans isomerase D
MLAQLRTLTRGPVAIILVLLMAVAFAIWGMPNMFSAASRAPAHVNGDAVSQRELNRLVTTFVSSQQAQDPTFTREAAIAQGVPAFALEQLVGARAMSQFVDRAGVTASNAQLAEAIRSMEQFQDAMRSTGDGSGFDPVAYRMAVQEMNFSVPEFETMLRGELGARQLFGALAAGARAPESFARFTMAFEAETRALSLVEVPARNPATIPAPTEEQLAAFYAERQQAWQRPERRTFTIVFADPSAFGARVEVTDDQLRAEFDRLSPQWSQPERRSFVQLVAPDQATAEAAAQRLSGGAEPEALAAELGMQLVAHDSVAQAELDDSLIAEAAFAMALGAPAQAVAGRLAPWSAVRLSGVTAAVTPSFEERREEIRQSIVQDESVELAQAAISDFEEQRRRRVGLAEAAAAVGLRVQRVENVSADGADPTGRPALTIPGAAALVSAAFATRQGRASDWGNLETGEDFSVVVEDIVAPVVPELAEVRDEVIQAFRITEANRLQAEAAEALVAAVNGGQTLEAAARAAGLRYQALPDAFSRRQVMEAFGPQLMGGIFAAQVNQATAGRPVRTMPDGQRQQASTILVMGVRTITPPDYAGRAAELEQFRAMGSLELEQSVSGALVQRVRQRARVDIDEAVIEAMYPSAAPAAQE